MNHIISLADKLDGVLLTNSFWRADAVEEVTKIIKDELETAIDSRDQAIALIETFTSQPLDDHIRETLDRKAREFLASLDESLERAEDHGFVVGDIVVVQRTGQTADGSMIVVHPHSMSTRGDRKRTLPVRHSTGGPSSWVDPSTVEIAYSSVQQSASEHAAAISDNAVRREQLEDELAAVAAERERLLAVEPGQPLTREELDQLYPDQLSLFVRNDLREQF